MAVWKSSVSWLAAALGCLAGFLALATLEMRWAPSPQWFGVAGTEFSHRFPGRTSKSQVRRHHLTGRHAGAQVCVAYENTDAYESRVDGNCLNNTDKNGLAVIRTYGQSRVRVSAEKLADASDFSSQPMRFPTESLLFCVP
jgi:hypothetical protein